MLKKIFGGIKMTNSLTVDFQEMTVVNLKGETVYPNNDSSLHSLVSNTIKKTINEFKEITQSAAEFLDRYPTLESLVQDSNQKQYNPNYLYDKFYSSFFIVKEHPIMLNRIVQSIVLEDLYKVENEISRQKEEMLYDEFFSLYKQKSIMELYEIKNNQSA